MDDGQEEGTVVRERVLLFEALTLLAQRQFETESTLVEQVNRNTSRIAAVERLCGQLETRLTDIDERLVRLSSAVHADPGLPQRVAALQAQIQRLGVKGTSSEPVHLAPADLPQPQRPQPPPPRPAHTPVPQAPPLRTDVPMAGGPGPGPESRPVPRQAPRARAVRITTSGDGILDRITTMTGQDRASMALMAAGVLVVAYAIVAQLRVG